MEFVRFNQVSMRRRCERARARVCVCVCDWEGVKVWLKKVHPVLGETVACAIISPHLDIVLYILTSAVQCYQPLRQLPSDFGDFGSVVLLNILGCWLTY